MKKFLEEVAGLFAGRDDLQKICFVFPNRRSSYFFQRFLGLAAGKPVIAPRLVTIDDLFTELSPYALADKIEALKVLYDCYVELKPLAEGQERESFDKFLFWGDIILRDFDDIDKYLVDADKLLVNIKDLHDLSVDYDFLSDDQKKAISEFCFGFDPEKRKTDPSDKKEMFMETWSLLLPLYNAFRERLASQGKAYAGMIYRQVAQARDISVLKEKYSEVVFVGLNALNNCERVLLDEIRKEGFGDFYWDFCGDMVCDSANKASLFISRNIAEFPSKHPLTESTYTPVQNFEVISVPSATGQTQVAGDIIASLGCEDSPVETAVVLPDESLLFPMLGAVPESVENVNVTMGYPLSASSAGGFFAAMERLQSNARIRKGEPAFYHKDVTEMIEHPYFVAAERALESTSGRRIISQMRRDNSIFVSLGALQAEGELFEKVFRFLPEVADIPLWQKDVVYYIQQWQTEIEREFLYRYSTAIESLEKLGILGDISPKTWHRLLAQYASMISIPYSGEPLGGLQIMGPLETRALDFKNIIMLSVGEGVFPSKSVSASFVPYNLRKGFGLPTYELQDSISSYYFYRSICRAENIFLLYDSRTEGLQNGEESRFIKQLKYHFKVPVKETVAAYNLSGSSVAQVRSVAKTPELMKILRDKYIDGDKYLSASSLNEYIECPLKFYWHRVREIREDDDVVEDLDASMFGSIYHRVMETLYKPYEGSVISAEQIRKLREDKAALGRLADEAFASQAKVRDIAGRNLILRNVIIKFVLRTLDIDAARAPFQLVGTESEVRIKRGGVNLGGKIDRIDRRGSEPYRLVDYKTGGSIKKDSIAFQLNFYAMLMRDSTLLPLGSEYELCIYHLRSFFGELPQSSAVSEEELDEFRAQVDACVKDIFNEELAFTGLEEDGDACKYCDFRKLCKKQ